MALLDFEKEKGEASWSPEDFMRYYMWYGYSAFHASDYQKALEVRASQSRSMPFMLWLTIHPGL